MSMTSTPAECRLTLCLCLLTSMLFVTCTNAEGVSLPTFTISASPSSLTIAPGNQDNSTITTTVIGGFYNQITLSASGLPSGTTASFSLDPIPAPGSGNSTMTISVGNSTPPGTYPITVTGTGGKLQQNTTVMLTVSAPGGNFTILVTPALIRQYQGGQGNASISTTVSGGFNNSIALSVTGLPSGTTASFNPNPIPAPGGGHSTMTITIGANTPAGTYPLTVTGNGGGIKHSAVCTLVVAAKANFSISASPSSLNIAQGNQGSSTITTTISGGFNSSIALSASGLPSGTTVGFNPNPIPAPGSGNSTMTITVGASTPNGTYPITVTGNGGGIQQNTTVTLTVTAPPNFTISASPSSLNIAQGNQGSSTITTTISDGFNSSIALSASGLPSGTTVGFNPNPIPAPGSGSSTMTITVGANTPTGTYPITVTGNGGGIQQNTTVTLTVIPQQQPNFSISASPSSLNIAQGNQGSSTITTTISGGFNSSIALSASGLPSGTTVGFNPNPIPAPGSGNSTMTITVGASTPNGTYPITVTGNGGGIQQNTTVILTVGMQSPPPNGIISYSISGTPPPPWSWVFSNFQMAIGGTGGGDSRGTDNAWTFNTDGCCIYLYGIYPYVLGTAATQGWSDPEGALLHMNIDYQPNHAYSAIEQFDAYEQPDSQTMGAPDKAVNGVFTLVGSTYTDVTVQAYCPTAGIPTDYWGNCANYPPNPVTVSDRLLIGYQTPFDTVNITQERGAGWRNGQMAVLERLQLLQPSSGERHHQRADRDRHGYLPATVKLGSLGRQRVAVEVLGADHSLRGGHQSGFIQGLR